MKWHCPNGIISMVVGFIILTSGGEKTYLGYIPFDPGKWYIAIGILVMFVGVFSFYTCYRKNNNGEKLFGLSEAVYMCPTCGSSFGEQSVKNKMCPDCGCPLESLSGFYKRHPEWIDKKQP